MTLEDASCWLEQEVYNLCLFIERLEHMGKVSGNGHHAAQNIAATAKETLTNRWNKEAEVEMLAKRTMKHVRDTFPESKEF